MQDSPKWLFEENMAKPDSDRLAAYINSIPEALVAINSEGVIEMANSAAMSLLNSNRPAGQPLKSVMQLKDESGQPVDLFELMKTSSQALSSSAYSLEGSDGSTLKLALDASPIKSQIARADGGFIILFRKASA